jgi:hypothetical protein
MDKRGCKQPSFHGASSLAFGPTQYTMKFQPQNNERLDKLLTLSSIDAVQALLDSDFGIGDESELLMAIRRDIRITASDDDITDTICDIMKADSNATTCLEHLAALN